MHFPEWLYRLLPGDQGTQKLGLIWREASGSSAATVVSCDPYTVPSDKCLVLTNVTGSFLAGAAQKTVLRRVMADPPAGTVRYNIHEDHVDSAVNTAVSLNWVGEVVIPGGWKVRIEGQYDAGAAANTVSGEIFGYLIPRGTFVFG